MFTVANRCQIIDYLGLKDSSRKLVVNYAISFVISLYLILHACVKHLIEQLLEFKRRNQTPPYLEREIRDSLYLSQS